MSSKNNNNNVGEEFVSEPIKPVAGTFEPDAMTRIGSPVSFSLNTSDFAICETLHPTLSAASWAVRVEPGNSFTSKEKPQAERKSCTRFALSLSFDAIIICLNENRDSTLGALTSEFTIV